MFLITPGTSISMDTQSHSYQVKAGDTQSWIVTKYKREFDYHLDSHPLWKEDGTYVDIELKKGMKIKVEITKVNSTDAFGKRSYDNVTGREEYLLSNYFIDQTLDNKSFWEERVKDSHTMSLEGNNIIREMDFTNHVDLDSYEDKLVRNWKTGWLVSHWYKATKDNQVYEIEISNESEGNGVVSGYTFLPLILALFVTVIIHRKWHDRNYFNNFYKDDKK